MLVKTTIKRTYWLIFKPGKLWYSKFLKRNYGHVMVITNNGNQWIQLDPVSTRLEPYIYYCPVETNLPKIYANQEGTSVIKIVLNELDDKRTILRPFFIITCVEIVKYIIGLRVFCVTPWGLYRKLLRLTKRLKKPYGIDTIELVL